MKLNEAIKISCDFLELNDLKDKIGAEEVDEENAVLIARLLNCANLAYEEIVTEYLPILRIQSLQAVDGRISFSSFDKAVCGIVAVQDDAGNEKKYQLSADHILIEDGSYKITYQIIPEQLSLGDEINVIFPERLLAYGIAREYLFLQDQSDAALIFEKRFKEALANFVRKKSKLLLPRRRWHA